jgi:hypothetical protein
MRAKRRRNAGVTPPAPPSRCFVTESDAEGGCGRPMRTAEAETDADAPHGTCEARGAGSPNTLPGAWMRWRPRPMRTTEAETDGRRRADADIGRAPSGTASPEAPSSVAPRTASCVVTIRPHGSPHAIPERASKEPQGPTSIAPTHERLRSRQRTQLGPGSLGREGSGARGSRLRPRSDSGIGRPHPSSASEVRRPPSPSESEEDPLERLVSRRSLVNGYDVSVAQGAL